MRRPALKELDDLKCQIASLYTAQKSATRNHAQVGSAGEHIYEETLHVKKSAKSRFGKIWT